MKNHNNNTAVHAKWSLKAACVCGVDFQHEGHNWCLDTDSDLSLVMKSNLIINFCPKIKGSGNCISKYNIYISLTSESSERAENTITNQSKPPTRTEWWLGSWNNCTFLRGREGIQPNVIGHHHISGKIKQLFLETLVQGPFPELGTEG